MSVAALLARWRVDLLLLAVAVVWGSSYLVAKVLVSAASVPAVLALRFTVATVALSLVWSVCRRPRPGWREVGVGVLLGGTQAAVLALETYGVAGTSATNAGLLVSLAIMFTPVLDSVASRRWLPPTFFASAGVALLGVVLLVANGGLRMPAAGDALVLGAAAVRALHVTALSHLTRGRPFDTLTLTLVQSAVCAFGFAAADPGRLAAAASAFGAAQWLGVAYLALACSVFAFFVQLWAVRRTSASRASLLMGTEPVWAVLIGLSLGGERLGPVSAAGAVLVVVATFWGQRVETRHRLDLAALGPLPAVLQSQPSPSATR